MNPEEPKSYNPEPVEGQPTPPAPPVPEILPTAASTETLPINQSTNELVNPVMHEIPKKKSGFVILLVVLLILVSLGSLGYWAYQNYFVKSTNQPISQSTNEPSPTATADPTANWKTYDNISYNYSIEYPSDFAVNENGMGGGNIQKATAITVSEAVAKKIESPAFAITVRAEAGETLQGVANKHYQALLINQLTETDKQATVKNLGFVWSDNQTVNPMNSSNLLDLPSFEYSISGSKIDDGAAEYGVPAETHKYIWFEKDKRFFLISFTEVPTMNQILSTFKFIEQGTGQ